MKKFIKKILNRFKGKTVYITDNNKANLVIIIDDDFSNINIPLGISEERAVILDKLIKDTLQYVARNTITKTPSIWEGMLMCTEIVSKECKHINEVIYCHTIVVDILIRSLHPLIGALMDGKAKVI